MNRCRAALAVSAFAIAALTVWVHWPSVENGYVYWDDDIYLGQAARLDTISVPTTKWAFTATRPFYYQPLSWLSHVLDWQLWGSRLAGHHATSVLLHGVNTALIFILTLQLVPMLGNGKFRRRWVVATAVAVVFGIHPLQVESVAWIAERKTVLSALFTLSGLIAYVKFTRHPAEPGPRWWTNSWWWSANVLIVAALLSKPMAVSVPVVMLVLDYHPLRRLALGWKRLLSEKAFLFAVSAAISGITLVAQIHEGAVRGLDQLGLWPRALVATRASLFYLWKLVWPAWLSPYYPLEARLRTWEPEFVICTVAFFAITGLALWKRRQAPSLLAGWMAYLALLLPVSGLVHSGAQVAADRFAYLALTVPVVLAAWGCVWLWRQLGNLGRIALILFIGCDLMFFGLRTREQIAVWDSDESLWRTVIARYPNSGIASCQLAMALGRQGRYPEALQFAHKGVIILPNYCPGRATLGLLYLRTGRIQDAVAELEEAVRCRPNYWLGRYLLAGAYARAGEFEKAVRTLHDLLAQQPGFAHDAARDPELAAVRDHPDYRSKVQSLLDSARRK